MNGGQSLIHPAFTLRLPFTGDPVGICRSHDHIATLSTTTTVHAVRILFLAFRHVFCGPITRQLRDYYHANGNNQIDATARAYLFVHWRRGVQTGERCVRKRDGEKHVRGIISARTELTNETMEDVRSIDRRNVTHRVNRAFARNAEHGQTG